MTNSEIVASKIAASGLDKISMLYWACSQVPLHSVDCLAGTLEFDICRLSQLLPRKDKRLTLVKCSPFNGLGPVGRPPHV
jgi:hypothetical protein